MPSRAFVAGFFTTFILRRPGSVNRPGPRRLFLMMPLSDSNTAATCLRDSSVSLVIWATISDFVGAPPFFAITRLLVEIIRSEKNASLHLDSARNISHGCAQANVFRCSHMPQMPCFLGSRAHAHPWCRLLRAGIRTSSLYESSPRARTRERQTAVEVCVKSL